MPNQKKEKEKEVKMTTGIYKMTNKINGHSYIGMSKILNVGLESIKDLLINQNEKTIKRRLYIKRLENTVLIISLLKF